MSNGANTTTANGIDIHYETFGSASDPTVLLVMGLTAQMIAWDTDFCRALADNGRHVVRFDNRDAGLSHKFDGQRVDMEAFVAAQFTGAPMPDVPYLLSDMADDAFGLLDALSIDVAHIVGASMGGMIVQTMAIERPERVLSMTSMWSTTGNPDYLESSDEAMAALMAPSPPERDAYIDDAESWAVWSSRKHFDLDDARARAAAAYDRSYYPEGAERQFAAIAASPDREAALAELAVPTLVIHGRDDELIRLKGGLRTAELVPGADLLLVGDMGHDLPRPLHGLVVDAIVSHTGRVAG